MPDSPVIERSTVIQAPASAIEPYLTDFHRWVDWSPWEGQDPDLKRTYEGTPGTVGSSYAWKGNRKAGSGTMSLTHTGPSEVDVALNFTAPFKSQSAVTFRLAEASGATTVAWAMTAPQNLAARIMGKFINMDKMLGGDFEKGLAKLKSTVETADAH